MAIVLAAFFGALGVTLGAFIGPQITTRAQRREKRMELAAGLAQKDLEFRLLAADKRAEATGQYVGVEVLPMPVSVEFIYRFLELIEDGEFTAEKLRGANESMLPLAAEVKRFSNRPADD